MTVDCSKVHFFSVPFRLFLLTLFVCFVLLYVLTVIVAQKLKCIVQDFGVKMSSFGPWKFVLDIGCSSH